MGKFLGEGYDYRSAKERFMKNDTVEGADLVMEIGNMVKKDFDLETLPLMIGVIETICDEKT